MTDPSIPSPALPSLDPADWGAFRRTAHDLLDNLIDGMVGRSGQPVWRPLPDAVRAALAAPPGRDGEGAAAAVRRLTEQVMPYGGGNTHPRFWGWVQGGGTAGGMLAEMATAALNANCGGRDHVGVHLELAVMDWVRGWFGFPAGAGGLLTDGTSVANLLGLAAARHQHLTRAGRDVRADGVGGLPLVGYASAEAHSCVPKAFETLGLGHKALRRVPVDGDFRLDLGALRAAIAADRAAGLIPFCVIGTAGTVNSGAIDPLADLADVAAAEGLWFHVDGAFAAPLVLSQLYAPRLAGLERADSIAFDFHKWLHAPYGAGCLLVRDLEGLRAAFSMRPGYLKPGLALAGGALWPCDLGIELSREFRALKIWFSLRELGLDRLVAAMENNCRQAAWLGAALARQPRIHLTAPVNLQIVCCRLTPPGPGGAVLDEAAVDAYNAACVADLQLRGIAAPSTCEINARTSIRVCITNHRTRDSDLVVLVDTLARYARHPPPDMLPSVTGIRDAG